MYTAQLNPERGTNRDLPYGTLEAFQPFLDPFEPPQGSFDASTWKHSFSLYLFAQDKLGSRGCLDIERRPARDGSVFNIDSKIVHLFGGIDLKAEIVCRGDELATLRSWRADSVLFDDDGKAVSTTRVISTGRVSEAGIEWTHAGRKRSARVSGPVVAPWSLLGALQRLPAGAGGPLKFTLLDDLEMIKPAQRIIGIGPQTAKVARGAKLALRCWEQTGNGILPTHYWQDSQGRVLFWIAGQRAYLYDADARQKIQSIEAGRKRRNK